MKSLAPALLALFAVTKSEKWFAKKTKIRLKSGNGKIK